MTCRKNSEDRRRRSEMRWRSDLLSVVYPPSLLASAVRCWSADAVSKALGWGRAGRTDDLSLLEDFGDPFDVQSWRIETATTTKSVPRSSFAPQTTKLTSSHSSPDPTTSKASNSKH